MCHGVGEHAIKRLLDHAEQEHVLRLGLNHVVAAQSHLHNELLQVNVCFFSFKSYQSAIKGDVHTGAPNA